MSWTDAFKWIKLFSKNEIINMKLFKFLLPLLVYARKISDKIRIIDGEEVTNIEDHPYMASLQGNQKCL